MRDWVSLPLTGPLRVSAAWLELFSAVAAGQGQTGLQGCWGSFEDRDEAELQRVPCGHSTLPPHVYQVPRGWGHTGGLGDTVHILLCRSV